MEIVVTATHTEGVTVDVHDFSFVCDPAHGRLLKYVDLFPAA